MQKEVWSIEDVRRSSAFDGVDSCAAWTIKGGSEGSVDSRLKRGFFHGSKQGS